MARPAIPTLMKAIQVAAFGGPEVMKVASGIPVPKPTSKQVLIQVKYAGINPVDTYIRAGNRPNLPSLPFIPGKDGAGLVVAVGDGVSKFKEGDRVYTQWADGSYAEFTLAEESNTHRLHDSVSYKGGAAIGVPYFTAYRAIIQKCRAKAGEIVFIHGASGAAGLACVQIARACDMTVYGTAGTSAGMDLVKQHGAHHVFNHTEDGYVDKIMATTSGKGVNVIVEMLANVNLENDLKLMAQHGRIALVGSRGSLEITPRLAMGVESSIMGVMLPLASEPELEEISNFLFAGQEQGWVKPEVGQVYDMSDAPTAHIEIIAHTGGARGKIVLNITDC